MVVTVLEGRAWGGYIGGERHNVSSRVPVMRTSFLVKGIVNFVRTTPSKQDVLRLILVLDQASIRLTEFFWRLFIFTLFNNYSPD